MMGPHHDTMRLHIGRRCTGISIEPDGRYFGMWRVRWSDGQLSNMANRTRAKDAVLLYARAALKDWSTPAHWRTRQTQPEAPPAAVSVFREHDQPEESTAGAAHAVAAAGM
jgi:hypothetical protein